MEQTSPGTKAGVAVRGFPPDQVDEEFLELYFGKFGEVQHIHILGDQKVAYVEYADPSVISTVVSKSHTIRKCSVAVEEVDLLEILQPYLVVKGFPPFVNDQMLTQHFKAAANDAEVDSIQLKGSEATVFYVDPKVALQVATKEQIMFGTQLTVEVAYSSPKPQEECALTVKGLPPMDVTALKPAVEYYFKQLNQEVVFCEIVDQVAYLKFSDPTVVQKIVSEPPTQEFLAGVKLQMGSIPVSEVPSAPEIPTPMAQQSASIDISKIHEQHQQQQATVHGQIPLQGHPSGPHPPSPYGTPPDKSLQHHGMWTSPGGHPNSIPHPQSDMWATPVSGAHRAPSPLPDRQNLEGGSFRSNSLGNQQLLIEDLDCPYPQRPPPSQQPPPPILAQEVIPNQVVVEGFPQGTQEFVLQLYLGNLSQPLQCTGVKMYGKVAVATFAAAIDFNSLIQKSRMMPFPQGNQILTLTPSKPPDTVIVSDLPENTQDFVLQLYFQQSSPVERVKLVSPNQALVTFKSYQNVQQVLSQQHVLGTTPIRVQEYCPFSDPILGDQTCKMNDLSNPHVQPQLSVESPPHAKHMWVPLKKKIDTEKHNYLHHTLSKLNSELENVKAHASIEEDRSKGVSIVIIPQQGASELADWEERVSTILSDLLASFIVSRHTFPAEAKGEVLEYTTNLRNDHPELYVKTEGDTLILAGNQKLVNEVLERVVEICETFRVVSTSLVLQRKHIKYLMQFCKRDLDTTVAGVEYIADSEGGVINITANPRIVKAFQDLIDEKTQSIQEKTLMLTTDAYKLLSSKRGKEKIEASIGTSISRLIYDFEVTSADGNAAHQLCFLSPTKELCKGAIKTLKPCVHQKVIPVSATKVKACNIPEWKELEEKLNKEFFIQISVKPESIIVTGESIAVEDVATKISQFIHDQMSVQDHVVCQISEWKVIKQNMFNEINAVKDQAKQRNVQVVYPNPNARDNTVKILILGEHAAVHDVKVQIEMLQGGIHQKETRVTRVAGLLQVLQSMEDKLRVLEQTHKAVIEVDIERDDNDATGITKPAGEKPIKVSTATANDGSKVTVFTGDFTQVHVGTIVNFVTPDPNYSQGNLKTLIAAGGSEVRDNLHSKISQFLVLSHGQSFVSSHGQLKCTQLLHCIIPPWAGGRNNESYFLEESIRQAFATTAQFGTLLITPVTAPPFRYPVNVFAEKVIEAVTDSYDVQVMVFTENISHAKAFEESLRGKKFQIHSLVQSGPVAVPQIGKPDSARGTIVKAISGQISSFISLSQGDMLKQEADVYINSTNKDLDLSQGQVSKLLLKACGKQLQEQCKEYAPLGPGAVAVTTAKNLKCKYIFHVSLPNHGSSGSERVFRETVQNILKAAQTKGASSIAIPSLGVAGLGYPASVSAKILFEEVIAFHIRNPSAIQKFYFVIYEKSIHQEFSKVYAQRMSQPLASGQDIPQSSRDRSVGSVAPSHVRRSSSSDRAGSDQRSTRLYVVQENITDESTDAIVNTTTEDMNLSAGGVSKAISRKAGPKLQMICKQLVDNGLRLEQGKIAVTNACGQLRCKRIIHAHLPVRSAASHAPISPQKMVEKIVTACVGKAEEEGLRSISFPAFGIGAAGYSIADMAEPMLSVLQKFGQKNPKSVEIIRIVILDQKLHQDFYDYFCKFFNIDTASQGSHGILHSIGASLKATLGFGGKDGVYVELQPGGGASTGVLSVRGPGSPVAVNITPSALPNPVAVFRIYAASKITVDQIEQEIRENVKQRVTTAKIEEEYIGYLIDDDIKEIEAIGDGHGVVIKIMQKIKQITISGEQRCVSHAQMKITSMLHDIEKAQSELQIYEWQSQDGETFESYPPEANARLERAFKKGIPAIEMAIDDIEVIIDLKKYEEISKTTGFRRGVKRVKKMQVDYPMTWEEQPKEGGRAKACHKFDVLAGTPEYQDAVREFEATIQSTKYTIIKVQRIQNPNEYAKHCSFRETLQQKHAKKVEERRLFHGTRLDSVDAIAHQAFNRIFAADANAAVFGKGVYFAVNASYSAQKQYAVPDSSGQQYIYVCNVVIGAYTKGSREMKIAPPLPNNPHVLYDSLVNDEHNPAIFVAMSDSQAYPEYLITFKST